MNPTYKDGQLSLDLVDVICGMTEEEQLNLVESLSCQESVIKFVMQQVITGWTDSGYHGIKGISDIEPHSALEKAIRQIANQSSEVAKKEIESLCLRIKIMEEQERTRSKEITELNQKLNSRIS
jgi:hypothetical protein